MTSHDSLHDVIQRLDDGDPEAAEEVFRRFANRLIAYARNRLDGQVLQKVDAEDVLQSVFRSFFVRQAKGEFEFASWDSLWGLLVKITWRKCGRQVKSLTAECRNIRREITPKQLEDSHFDSWDMVAREPSPNEVVALNETLEGLMSSLDTTQRQIVELKLQNYDTREIAEKIGSISERKVYRVLEKVRQKLTDSASVE